MPARIAVLVLTALSNASALKPDTRRSSITPQRPRNNLDPKPPLRANQHTHLIAAKADKLAPEPADKIIAGLLAVAGGVLIHVACGTMYTWGNLISYMPPHLKYWGGAAEAGGVPDAQLVLPLILVSQMVGMPFGPILESYMGPALTAALGALMMGSGVFAASYAPSLASFVASYAILFGLGVGIAYQMPLIVGARWFPGKKGAVTGAIVAGMGSSALIFNTFDTRIVNPLSINMEGGVFPAAVYARWPGLLRTLGLIYVGLALAGALLQRNPPGLNKQYPFYRLFARGEATARGGKGVGKGGKGGKGGAAAAAAPAKRSVLADVCSFKFATMWLAILTSAVSGLCITGTYKTFGAKQPQLNSDAFLSLVGSLAAIFGNAAGRFFWGGLSDVAGFKRPFVALTLVQFATMISFSALAKRRATFALATVAMLFCMGGNFAMFPAQTLRVFGDNGAKVYSFLFTGFGSAALLGPIISSYLLEKGGFALVYNSLGCLSLISTLLAATLM